EMLQIDPSLEVGARVIFDEFHERSLHADLGLALTLQAQALVRPEMRLLVMSATLGVAPVAGLIGNAPIVVSEGREFPIATHYEGDATARRGDTRAVEARVVATV